MKYSICERGYVISAPSAGVAFLAPIAVKPGFSALRACMILAVTLIKNVLQTSIVIREILVEILDSCMFFHTNNIALLLPDVKGYLRNNIVVVFS
jgi:hypothetical protein